MVLLYVCGCLSMYVGWPDNAHANTWQIQGFNDTFESLQAAYCILGRCFAACMWIRHHPGKVEKRM